VMIRYFTCLNRQKYSDMKRWSLLLSFQLKMMTTVTLLMLLILQGLCTQFRRMAQIGLHHSSTSASVKRVRLSNATGNNVILASDGTMVQHVLRQTETRRHADELQSLPSIIATKVFFGVQCVLQKMDLCNCCRVKSVQVKC